MVLGKFRWLTLLLFVSASFATQPVNLPRVVTLMNLNERARQKLLRDGVLMIADWSETNLWKAYDDLTRLHGLPIFVTTDACLYQFYELHKAAVREAEVQGFLPLLRQLVKDWTETTNKAMSNPQAQREVRHAAFVLAVAGKLLDDKFPVPEELREQVNSIVREIVFAQHVAEGLPFGEDFTQYKPRGHYTTNEELQRYFRAVKWLARRVYNAQKTDQLRQAVTLLWLLEQTPNGLERYRLLVNAIVSLAGEPVGMPLTELHRAIKAIGRQTGQVIGDTGALEVLKNEIAKPEYGQARIVTHPVPPIIAPPPQLMPQKQIRLLPEVQLPDSEILQWTSDPQVPNRIPSGLDIAAALGSQRAIELLRQTSNGNLVLERLKPFMHTWSQLKPEYWQGSVYRLWLWSIKAVLETDEQAPKFMKNPAWQDWKLNTALASWAQLRHAYGLYGAPVYIYAGLIEDIPRAYLEPNPKCYERLALAAEKLQEVLSKARALSERMDSHLRRFANLMRRFVAIAEKERRGEPLSEPEIRLLAGFADIISPFPRETPVTVMDIVTHSQTGEVLHVASGKLHPVLVVVDAKPYEPFVAVGWSLSYYEFTRPNFERLTDADWEKWLNKDVSKPEPPVWANSFRWSAYEDLDGFTDLRHAESLLTTKPDEAVRLLREVAKKHEGKWIGAKAHLILARHFVEIREFEEAQKELEAFYRASNMRLMVEADEICLSAVRKWEQWSKWQKAQPYLQRLLKLTELPEKPLPPNQEQERQDLRAKVLLLQTRLSPSTWRERIEEAVTQILKECPKSRFVPVARAILWVRRVVWVGGVSPPEHQIRQIIDEAINIISEYPSSLAAWTIANMVWDLVRDLAQAERLLKAVSQLRKPPDKLGEEERELLDMLLPAPVTPIIPFDRMPIDFKRLAELYVAEGNFKKAWEAAQKAEHVDTVLKTILEAWRQEGNEVARLLWRAEKAWMEDDIVAMLQACETFVQKFPKSRYAALVLLRAIRVCEMMGENEKAAVLEKQLLEQFPRSEEVKRLLARQREGERKKREGIAASENFILDLLKGTKIDPQPYIVAAKTDLPSVLDKLIDEHPELKEKVVKWAMEGLKSELIRVMLRKWLTEHFCKHHPDDPLAYEVMWQLQVAGREREMDFYALPILVPFLSAPEGTPHREQAEKLLERILARKPERRMERDPFLDLLELAEQFPTFRPRALLSAGEWAMEERDWETAKNLLTEAAKSSNEEIRKRANEALKRLEQLRQPAQKIVKQVWEASLWKNLPPSQKAEDCLKALMWLADLTLTNFSADTDGRWLAIGVSDGLFCIDLESEKVAWQRAWSWNKGFWVANGVVMLRVNVWRPSQGEVAVVKALDASSGKTLWQREFKGERFILGKWQNRLAFAEYNFQKDKGKLVLINPRTGEWESEKPISWNEYLEWQRQLQATYLHDSPQAFLTDEQGRLVKMWICERWWRSPDGTVVVVMQPNGKVVAYKVSH